MDNTVKKIKDSVYLLKPIKRMSEVWNKFRNNIVQRKIQLTFYLTDKLLYAVIF